MNKENYFKKFGAAISGGVVLSSVVVPSLTVVADELCFSKDENINTECNASWLCWLYYIFRFDFVKKIVLNRVGKILARHNCDEIYKLMAKTNGAEFSSDGEVNVKIEFSNNVCYSLSLSRDFTYFGLTRKGWRGSYCLLHNNDVNINYGLSIQVISNVKSAMLTKRLCDSLVESGIEYKSNEYGYIFSFSNPGIVIQNGKKVSRICINTRGLPGFTIFYGNDGFALVNSSANELEEVVDEIIKQLEGKKKAVHYNLDSVSSGNN